MPLIKMTERKLAANRANAQKSTGPRTAAGKAVTRFNALQHGCRSREIIIPTLGESLEDFQAFHAAILADLNPPSPLHASLAEEFIATFWLIRRARRLQTQLEIEAAEKSAEQQQTAPTLDPHTHLARELAQPGRRQRRYFSLSRHQNRLHNSAHRTLARFYRLPIFLTDSQEAISQTIQPKSPFVSMLSGAAMAAIFAIILAAITPIASAAPKTASPTFQPKTPLFSTQAIPLTRVNRHPILSPVNIVFASHVVADPRMTARFAPPIVIVGKASAEMLTAAFSKCAPPLNSRSR